MKSCTIFCSSEAALYGSAGKTLRGTVHRMLLAMLKLFALDHLGSTEDILGI